MAIKNIYVDDNVKWWSELNHGGMLISPVLVEQYFENIDKLSNYKYNQLRDKYISFESIRSSKKDIAKTDTEVINKWVDYVIQVILEHNPDNIAKGKYISDKYKLRTILGQSLTPDRVIFSDASRKNPILLVSIQKTDKIGVGKDRKKYTEFIDLLRGTGVKLGLLTNGVQFRLCYAGIDYDAWTEWDASMWFIEAEWRKQLDGFIALVGKKGLDIEDNNPKLKRIIEESRNKQSEISDILGQQIREAVEILINQLDITVKTNPELLEAITKDIDNTQKSDQQINNALYQAASRIIMRIVVLLFAEARNLLPMDIIQYNESYGIEGLFEQLKMALVYENKLRVKNQYSAWRRIISLFNLVHEGSSHYVVPLQGYGGILFERGNLKSEDEILQCIAIFESIDFKLSDYQVYEILEKIKIGKLKVKQGNKNVWVKGPVDFADLKTEYIGIMYEGLLDYSLKRATEPLIVLNIGKQPILPLSHLDSMKDKEIKDLLKNLRKDKTSELKDGDTSNSDIDILPESVNEENLLDEVDKRVKAWSLRAVQIENKVKKTKSMDDYTYNKACEKEADKLVIKILHEGEYYIASQGGTRKGSGTFYTKPGLAIPTTQRTLKPLLYDEDSEGNDIPKKPKDILGVKVCDPTCGSGTFLVAATDYITDALTKSILYYGSYTTYRNSKTRVLPFGKSSKGNLDEELISVPPDDPKFEEHLRANLRRHVVERCIYGVDINPMAVELAKLALWINTMNIELPFTFLDHKIKVGNGLVGTWFDQFKHYPILAWNREGGDKDHSNGIHYKKGEWTEALKEFMDKKVKPDMVRYIESIEYNMKLSDVKEEISNKEIEEALENAIEILEEFNDLPMSANGMRVKEEIYKNKILNNKFIQILKEAFDEWCALWFWPADELDEEVPMPMNFHNISDKAKERVKRISRELKFFHWELEFPEIFTSKNNGFTAILGNPPWDSIEANSNEFFIKYDPIYRTRTKQKAISIQNNLFVNKDIERLWIKEKMNQKAIGNWISKVSSPFADIQEGSIEKVVLDSSSKYNDKLYEIWREFRSITTGYRNLEHSFRCQGKGEVNKYKLFLEQSCRFLKLNGRLGLIIPSGLYSDNGTIELREYLINCFNWEWIFAFQNRERIFDIDSTFKFCIIICEKGMRTESYINTSFMNTKVENWNDGLNHSFKYPIKLVSEYSPINKAFLEIVNKMDIEIIRKVYEGKQLLINSSEYIFNLKSEYNMTTHSDLFISINDVNKDYIQDRYGRWIKSSEVFLPLYQGIMINQFDFTAKLWESGTGLTAKWKESSWENKRIYPQFVVNEKDINNNIINNKEVKIFFRSITKNTNSRTMISSITPYYPSGNSLTKIDMLGASIEDKLIICDMMNSFVFDYILRLKCGGTNLNKFILKECPIFYKKDLKEYLSDVILYSAKIQLSDVTFAKEWIELSNSNNILKKQNWYSMFALTEHERLRIKCILDAIIAEMYGLNYSELEWILKDDTSNLSGFWRVDKDKPFTMRQTTLVLVAFKRLKEIGIEEFLKEDWQLPEDVAKAMGPRFLDWQFEKSVEESWEECEEHARAFLGDEEYKKFIEKLGLGGLAHA